MRGAKRLKCALILSAACSGGDSDSQLSEELDGGGSTGNDAAMEDPQDAGPDATEPPIDAGADASPPADAGPVRGSITVTTYVRCCDEAAGTIKADVEVVTVNPDGTLGPSGRTGVDGKLTLEGVYEGSLVTALYEPAGESTDHDYVTFAAVKPGDSLTFGEAYYQQNARGTEGEATASFPAFDGASYYRLTSPCDDRQYTTQPSAVTLYLYESCQTSTSPVLATAYNANDQVIGARFVPDLATTPGATPTIPALNPVTSQNFTVTRGPVDPGVREVRFAPESVFAPVAFIGHSTADAYLDEPGEVKLNVPTDGLRQFQSARFTASYQYAPHELYVAVPPTTTAATVSGGGELPWLAGANITPLGVTWLQTDGTYDGAVASLSWSREAEPQGNSWHYYQWTVIIPPGQTSLRWDHLASTVRDRLPAFTDSINSNSDLMLIDLTGPENYDELRAIPEWMLTCPSCAVHDGDLPSAKVTADGAEG